MCAFNCFQCLRLTHYFICFYRHLPQLGGQQKFPELIAGASGGMLIPTAVTQCTYVCVLRVCAHGYAKVWLYAWWDSGECVTVSLWIDDRTSTPVTHITCPAYINFSSRDPYLFLGHLRSKMFIAASSSNQTSYVHTASSYERGVNEKFGYSATV